MSSKKTFELFFETEMGDHQICIMSYVRICVTSIARSAIGSKKKNNSLLQILKNNFI